jgi:hypothetical protein
MTAINQGLRLPAAERAGVHAAAALIAP